MPGIYGQTMLATPTPGPLAAFASGFGALARGLVPPPPGGPGLPTATPAPAGTPTMPTLSQALSSSLPTVPQMPTSVPPGGQAGTPAVSVAASSAAPAAGVPTLPGPIPLPPRPAAGGMPPQQRSLYDMTSPAVMASLAKMTPRDWQVMQGYVQPRMTPAEQASQDIVNQAVGMRQSALAKLVGHENEPGYQDNVANINKQFNDMTKPLLYPNFGMIEALQRAQQSQ